MAVSDEQWVAMRHAALRAARKIVQDEQQAEDCAHEALAELLAKAEALRAARSVEALASTVARRRALDAVRQHDAVRRSILRLGSLLPPEVPDLSTASSTASPLRRSRAPSSPCRRRPGPSC